MRSVFLPNKMELIALIEFVIELTEQFHSIIFDYRTNQTTIRPIGFDWGRMIFGSVSFDLPTLDRIRYVQVWTCTVQTLQNFHQWKALKVEVRKTPTKSATFVKTATKFSKNEKICKIRKFPEHCKVVKEEFRGPQINLRNIQLQSCFISLCFTARLSAKPLIWKCFVVFSICK